MDEDFQKQLDEYLQKKESMNAASELDNKQRKLILLFVMNTLLFSFSLLIPLDAVLYLLILAYGIFLPIPQILFITSNAIMIYWAVQLLYWVRVASRFPADSKEEDSDVAIARFFGVMSIVAGLGYIWSVEILRFL